MKRDCLWYEISLWLTCIKELLSFEIPGKAVIKSHDLSALWYKEIKSSQHGNSVHIIDKCS